MKHQNLIIYQFPILYQILKELEEDINYNISEAKSQDSLRKQKMNLNDYIIVTNKKRVEDSFSLNLSSSAFPFIKF